MNSSEWLDLWVDLEGRRPSVKSPEFLLQVLGERFNSLPPKARAEAVRAICAGVTAADEGRRFAAIWLIWEFGLIQAVPALEGLLKRLEGESGPGAHFEARKVERLLADLRREHPSPEDG